MRMEIFVGVGLFAVVKVRRDGVLEEMNQQISAEHQQRSSASGELQAFGYHLDQSRGQHESRAQGDEVAKVVALPVLLHNHRAAKDVGRGGGETEQNAEDNGIHRRGQDSRFVSSSGSGKRD